MTIRLIAIAFVLTCSVLPAQAAPSQDLLARLIQIAEPDQIEAFSQLDLTDSQEARLISIARGYAPQLQSAREQPVRLMGLMSQALTDADKVLTPRQRPLLRKLLPRPHQWEKLKVLSSELKP
jgi:Spy/CpxP family protein refolding chaperone